MGKRSNFDRVERDFYPTPLAGVLPLIPHLEPNCRFIEPCAGDGALINHLTSLGASCVRAADVEPRRPDIAKIDARDWQRRDYVAATHFITNPPWSRGLLHEIIVTLSDVMSTWLLIDADWAHTRQAREYMPRCRKIVAVGRLKWIPDSKFTGKDNCAWHLFDKPSGTPAEFYGRT